MLKCQGCEAVVANGGLRPCDNCGRPVCSGCGIEVEIANEDDLARAAAPDRDERVADWLAGTSPPEADIPKSSRPRVTLCQKCWHEVFEIDEDD